MKTTIMIILALIMLGCGENNMATIGLETARTLASTNVTDDTQYYDTSSLTINSHNSDTSFLIQGSELFSSGSNTYGQLGLGDTTNRNDFETTGVTGVKSVFAGIYTTFILKTDGTLWASGGINALFSIGNIESNIFVEVPISGVKTISIGEYNAFILKTDGTLWGSGLNAFGELGFGDKTPRISFTNTTLSKVSAVSCGQNHTLIIKENIIFSTGKNNNGQLGLGTTVDVTSFTTTNKVASFISCGYSHSLCIAGGELFATGDNIAGQLGLGDKTDRVSFVTTGVTSVLEAYGGWVHSVLRKTNGDLYGAGANNVGQIGLGATAESTTFTTMSVTATGMRCGYNHTLAIVSNTTYSTGYNANGQLGLGDNTTRTTFTTTSETTDSYIAENWKYFYGEEYVRNNNYRYIVSVVGTEAPSIFVSLSKIGAVNEQKPFDDQNTTPAISSSPMTYTIKGLEEFNAFTLAKVLATSVTYTFKDSLGDTVKNVTIPIDCKRDANGILSHYPTTVAYYAGIQMETDSTVEISIVNTAGDVELGDCTFNNAVDSGDTNLSFSHGIQDFNNYTPDDWGNIPEAVKAKVTTFNVTMDVLLANYDYAVSFNESIAGKNVTIDASDSNGELADGVNVFASLTRRVRVINPAMKSNVKDEELGEYTTLTMKVQEIA